MDQEYQLFRKQEKEKQRQRLDKRQRRHRDDEDSREDRRKRKHKHNSRSRSNQRRRDKSYDKQQRKSRQRSQKRKRSRDRSYENHHKRSRDRRDYNDSRKQQRHKHNDDRQKDKQRDRDRDKDRDRGRDRDRDRNRYEKHDQRRDKNHYEDRRDKPERDQRKGGQHQKDPYFQERRQIQRIRKKDPQKAQKMQEQLQKKIILDKKQRQIKTLQEKFKQAQKQVQQAKRQDHTILVYCLPLKAKEKDIWEFFFKNDIGKIRDIRIIKDSRSGKSKGVAYVEFYTSQSVQKALTMGERPFGLKGRQFMGLKIQHSQAEKNRAAAAAKQMRVTKPVQPFQQQQQTIKKQMKVMIGGLTDKLAQIPQSELKSLFQPFGAIQYVDIHRDPISGKCKGYAFIQFQNPQDGKVAAKQLNNIVVGGQKVTVQTVSTLQKGQVSANEEFLYSQGSKQNLAKKLGANPSMVPTHSNLARPPISAVSTNYVVFSNLFTMEGTNPGFFQQLKKEVMSACQGFGNVQKCFVQKNNQGNVWVKFTDVSAAQKAVQNLKGKYFENKKVYCHCVTDQAYQARVGV